MTTPTTPSLFPNPDAPPPAAPSANHVAGFDGNASNYRFSVDGGGRLSVTDKVVGSTESLSGINTLQFADRSWTWTVGQEVQVNTFTGGYQRKPAMATLADGGYVVIWASTERGTTEAWPTIVYGQRFDIGGAPQGEEFSVAGSSDNLSVIALPDGGFATTWMDDVQIQFFDASAVQQASLHQRPAMEDETSKMFWLQSDAVALDDGSVLLVWSDVDIAGEINVNGQRVSSSGVPLGGRLQINETPMIGSIYPSTNVQALKLNDGSVVVTWMTLGSHVAPVLYGRKMEAGSLEPGEQFRIASAADYVIEPCHSMSALADGGFVVCWNVDSGIVAQRFDHLCQSVGPAFDMVNGYYNFSFADSFNMTTLANGDLLVVWDTYAGINVRRFDAAGQALGDKLQVNTNLHHKYHPVVTALPDGGFVIAWESTWPDSGIYSQRFDANGNAVTAGAPQASVLGSALADVMDFSGSAIPLNLGGGAGDDTYVLGSMDNIRIQEVVGYREGVDTVHAAFHYTLGANLENLLLTGSAALNGTGNTLANALTGNSGANSLNGLAGHDRLDGGEGADRLIGGLGNDTYVTDSLSDNVRELAGEGTDTVESSVSLTLAANVENLILTGSGHLKGTGNEWDNVLTGNAGVNILRGNGGQDRFMGGGGDDLYYVDSTDDVVTEDPAGGNDYVYSTASFTLSENLERLYLQEGYATALNGGGNSGDNRLGGNSLDNILSGGLGLDTLYGLAGRDRLDGGGGADRLLGGAGDDTYVWTTARMW